MRGTHILSPQARCWRCGRGPHSQGSVHRRPAQPCPGSRHRSTQRLLSDWPSAPRPGVLHPRPGVLQGQNSQGTARLRAGGLGGAGWTLGPSHSHLTPHRYAGSGPLESSLWEAQRKITQGLTISCCLSWRRAGSPRLQLRGAMSVTSVLSARRARGLPWVLALRSRDPEAKGDCHPCHNLSPAQEGATGLEHALRSQLTSTTATVRPRPARPFILWGLSGHGPCLLPAILTYNLSRKPVTRLSKITRSPEMLCGWGPRGLCCWR